MSSKEDRKKRRPEPEVIGFVGVGLDNKDEEHRITRTEHFFLLGGSQETHERMQDTACNFQEGLKKRGKPLVELTLEEIVELFEEGRE